MKTGARVKKGFGAIAVLVSTLALGATTALASAPAFAAPLLYHFTGKVTGIRGDTVALSHGLETLESQLPCLI